MWNSDMGAAPKGGGADLVTDPNWIEPPMVLLLFENDRICAAHWDWYYAEGGRGCTDGMAWIEPCSGEQANLHYGNPIAWCLPQSLQDERRKVWEEAAGIAKEQEEAESANHVRYGEEGKMTACNASLQQAMMASRLASIFRAKAEE